MPVYEYQCVQCGAKQSFLVRRATEPFAPKCRSCGGENLYRLFSAFTFHRTWEGPPAGQASAREYSDPRQIGRRTEQRFRETEQELPGEVREMIDKARDGELPPDVSDF